MKRFTKVFKVAVASMMLFLQLFTPLSVTAFESVILDENNAQNVDAGFYPAITEYVPDMTTTDNELLDLEKAIEFHSILPLNSPLTFYPTSVENMLMPMSAVDSATASTASGIVQFVLEPVARSSAGNNTEATDGTRIPMATARAAAFNANTVTHQVFANATTNTVAASINGRYGRDAIFLGRSGNRYRIMIAGFIGYVNITGAQHNITVTVDGTRRTFPVRANAEFVHFDGYPASRAEVQTVSHYVNRNGELWRYLTNNVRTSGGFVRFLTGPAPSWMPQDVRLYSFDGIYFHTRPRDIRDNGRHAINADNPHFNYFQYLSFRSESTVTAAQLNAALLDPNVHALNVSNSVMRNQGNAFVRAQNRYGINALLMFAKAMHESAAGTSAIARANNNLFGLGAVDSAPGANAWDFATPADSINDLANGWLSRGYLWPGTATTTGCSWDNTSTAADCRYAGPHPGHKGSGMNVRYATDPYWGQKIAGWAHRIDRSRPANQRDLNRETIAISQHTNPIQVRDRAGNLLYTANTQQLRYFPFLVTRVSASRGLEIVTDPAIVNGVPRRTTRFNSSTATSSGYVPNNNVWLTGATNANNAGNNTTNNNNNNNQVPEPQVPSGTTRPTDWFAARTAQVTASPTLNVRTGPGTNHSLITTVNHNATVSQVGTNANGTWSLIQFGNQTGWVSTEFLNITNSSSGNNRGWVRTNGNYFHYNSRGERRTGWYRTGSRWYFLNPAQGRSGHNASLPQGAMLTGWVRTGSHWYFLNPAQGVDGHASNRPYGAMLTGWVFESGHWFNMRSGGQMRTGWVQSGGNWYFLNPASGQEGRNNSFPFGAMQTGWLRERGDDYFLNPAAGQPNHNSSLPHGAMFRGTHAIDGANHSFNNSGRWQAQ